MYFAAPGYSIVIDNVGKEIKSRHLGQEDSTGKKIHVWTMVYGLKNRVHGGEFGKQPDSDFTKHPASSATKQKVADFLPQAGDLECRRTYFLNIIKNILIDHMSAFKEIEKTRVSHDNIKAVDKRSELATIGVIQENPGTVQGMMAVADELQKYIPQIEDISYPIPIHGDAATVLMLLKALRARAASFIKSKRLDGMWPVPTEFHRRMLHLQDTYNIMYKASSCNERGTLANLKTVMNIQVIHFYFCYVLSAVHNF